MDTRLLASNLLFYPTQHKESETSKPSVLWLVLLLGHPVRMAANAWMAASMAVASPGSRWKLALSGVLAGQHEPPADADAESCAAAEDQQLVDDTSVGPQMSELEARIAARRKAELDAWTAELSRVAFLERDSAVPQYVYLKFKQAESNHEAAEVERMEKEELLRRKDENAANWEAHGRELVRESLQRQRRTKRHQRQLQRRKQAQVQAVQDEEASWQAEREKRRLQHERDMRLLVLGGKAAQLRMDKTEETEREHLRQQGTRHRAEIASAVAMVRQNNYAAKKKIVTQMRADIADHATELSGKLAVLRTGKAQEKREHAHDWKNMREKRDEEYLERARVNRQRALETRVNAKKAVADNLQTRKQGAAKERENDYLVASTKARILGENRKEVAAIYRRRFVTPRSANAWEGSSLKRLNAAAAWLASNTRSPQYSNQATLQVSI